jgi:hypothetical protein
VLARTAALGAVLLACSSPPAELAPDAGALPAECVPALAAERCVLADDFGCRWSQLVGSPTPVDALAPLIAGTPQSTDDQLRALFPAIGDRPLVDAPLDVPAGVTYDGTRGAFPPYAVPVPVDWAADPHGNNTWRLYYQSLRGFSHPDDALQAEAALLVSWVDSAMRAEPPLQYTWFDHALAMRTEHAAALVDQYLAESPTLNRRFLLAAAQLIVIHLYAMAYEGCYTAVHNHGISEDLAILGTVRGYPALLDGQRMWDHASARLLELQVRPTVSDDGINVENTPAYHLYGVEQLTQAIGAFVGAGEPPPAELVSVRDSMIEGAVHHLQPDLTYAQFGDCTDGSRLPTLQSVLDRATEQGVGDPAALDLLRWATSRGQQGSPPDVDRVYELGGYAFFRDRWDLGDVPISTTVHFKTSRLSGRHYHADETSFELFAHGRPLIVGPGFYTYASQDPLYLYPRQPAAQNILVVDGDDTVSAGGYDDRSRILAHGTSWVQGTHPYHLARGVTDFARTLAFVKPDVVVIVDHVAAPEAHEYAQHFHVHPDVTTVTPIAQGVIAQWTDGPSLAIIAAAAPELIDGWHFPEFQVARSAIDAVFSQAPGPGAHDLPALLVVTPPGQSPRIPTDLAYTEDGDQATVTWRLDGTDHAVSFPRR